MFKHFISVLLVSQLLSACIVAGVLVDGVIYSKADTNYDADLAQAPHMYRLKIILTLVMNRLCHLRT